MVHPPVLVIDHTDLLMDTPSKTCLVDFPHHIIIISVLLALALYRSSSYLSLPTSIVFFLSFYCQDYTMCRPNSLPMYIKQTADMLFVWINV